jgi:hypothetical protein
MDNTVATMPALEPPNHAAMTTAGKKKMKGNWVGPMVGVKASLVNQPRKTHPRATAYRSDGGLAFGEVGKLAAVMREVRSYESGQ